MYRNIKWLVFYHKGLQLEKLLKSKNRLLSPLCLNVSQASCPWSIYFSLNNFYTAPSETPLSWFVQFSYILVLLPPPPFSFFLCFCLTYVLLQMRGTVLFHFKEAVRPCGFAGADGKAVHGSSIQMDGTLPGVPHALIQRYVFPIFWPQELLCCKIKNMFK